jgi:hypothetical protein
METKKTVLMTVVAAAFVLLGAVSAFAQTARPEIIIGNGLGAEITGLILKPAKDQYAGNRNSYAQVLQANDQAVFSAEIPDHFLRYESFDIEVVAGGKRYVSRNGVRLDLNRGSPFLELSETGKDSTLPEIISFATATGTIIFLAATPTGRRILARNVLAPLRWPIGRVLDYRGLTKVMSYPLVGGIFGYFVGKGLTPKGLNVQVVYTNESSN